MSLTIPNELFLLHVPSCEFVVIKPLGGLSQGYRVGKMRPEASVYFWCFILPCVF